MSDKIVFNEYGQVTIPDAIWKAQAAFWNTVKPYLDSLTLVEVQALSYFLDLDVDLSTYIMIRQSEMRDKKFKSKEEGSDVPK